MENDSSLLNDFVTEAKEHLGSIEESLLALEKTKDAPDAELVGKVFRSIHSIKGAAPCRTRWKPSSPSSVPGR